MTGVICALCGAVVESGRLSCGDCGSLVAAVAGAGERAVAPRPGDARTPPVVEEPVLAADNEPERDPAIAEAARGVSRAPAGVAAAAVPGAYVARWSVGTPRFPRASVGSEPPQQPWPTQPPAPSMAATMAGPARPLATASPAGPSISLASIVRPEAAASAGPQIAGAASASAAGPASATMPRAGLLADLPLEAPDDIPSWLVLIGSVVALASFVLPWASPGGIVLGTQGGDSYFDRWGLASLSDVGLFLATLAVLALAIVPNRLPLQVRFGHLPIVLGGVELGVGWVYLGLSFGYGTGIVVLLVAAILLIVGSSLALRHPPGSPSV